MTNKYPLQLKCINNNDACIFLTVGKLYNGYTLGGMVTLQLDDCNVSDRQYKSNRFELINKEKEMTNYYGDQIGEGCGRDGCTGIIESLADDSQSCTCFRNPPCSKCTAGVYCPECGYDSNEEYKEKQMTTINLPVHKTIIVNPLQFNTSTSRVIDAYMYDERIIHIEHSYEFNNSGDPHSSYTLCIDGTKISDKINKGFDIGTIDIYNITDIYTAIAVCNEINQYCFTKFLTECSNYTI